jgi:putative hydrolase of the HAD superfamily
VRQPKPQAAQTVLFSDADNTLWDTNAVYAEAQNWLLDRVETEVGTDAKTEDRLAFVRRVDQLLAARHHEGLRYPTRLLANALALVLSGIPDERAVRRAWTEPASALPPDVADAFQEEFGTRLRRLPGLREGVAEGLRHLHDLRVTVFVLTEGALERVQRTLGELALAPYVERVLEGKKEPALYRRMLRLKHEPPAAYMVGDQLDRDIAPAKAAGLTTFYFPGGFTPRWTPHETEVGPDFKISSFTEVADRLEERLADRRLAAPARTRARNAAAPRRA